MNNEVDQSFERESRKCASRLFKRMISPIVRTSACGRKSEFLDERVRREKALGLVAGIFWERNRILDNASMSTKCVSIRIAKIRPC